ncbi:MAG: ABC transporter permease [Ktedonobacteraceae bacterium]
MSVKTTIPEELALDRDTKEPVDGSRQPRASARQRGRATQAALQRVLLIAPPILLAVFLLVSWYLGSTYGHVNSLILPAPGAVYSTLVAGVASGLFLSNALVTIEESLLGFVLALAIALPMGYGIARSRLFAATIQPYLAAGQAIPAIVIFPLLQLWLGYNLIPIFILCMLVVLFPMVITIALGFQTIDGSLVDAARVEGAAGWSMLARIEFPMALPAILAAIRTGLTLSIVGAIVGEFVNQGDQGLGSLVLSARNQFDSALLFATLIVMALMATLYFSASWLLTKLANRIY